jgi:hypothetical protein
MVKTIKRKRNKNKSKKRGGDIINTYLRNMREASKTKEQLAKSAQNANNHRKSLLINIG